MGDILGLFAIGFFFGGSLAGLMEWDCWWHNFWAQVVGWGVGFGVLLVGLTVGAVAVTT